MKKNFATLLLSSLLTLGLLSSCGEDTPDPTPTPVEAEGFDLWIPVKGATGKTQKEYDQNIIVRVKDLTKGTISITGKGADTGGTALTPHIIYRDGYYYGVSREGNFGKFEVGATVRTIKEFPLPMIKDRQFSHAWLDRKTVVLVGSTGKQKEVSWVRIDTQEMKLLDSGTLALKAPAEGEIFCASGLLGYRRSDNTLIFPHIYIAEKRSDRAKKLRGEIYVAFIDAATMQVKSVDTDKRADWLGSMSFGDNRTCSTFTDKAGNFYFVAAKILKETTRPSTTAQRSLILRVNSGAMETDKSYDAYDQPRGKIIDLTPVSDDEVMLYVQDPKQATPDNPIWDSAKNRYVFFWQILNLRTHKVRRIEGVPLSVGNFSHFAAPSGGKVYLGANVASGNSCIYIYDLKSGKVSKGAELEAGFEIERIVPVYRTSIK